MPSPLSFARFCRTSIAEAPSMSSSSKKKGCWNCGKTPAAAANNKDPPLMRCTRCQRALYCSRDCQVAHWKSGHKKECPQLQAKKMEKGAEKATSRCQEVIMSEENLAQVAATTRMVANN